MTKGNRGSRRTGRDVGTYRHEETKRKNNPEVGLANWEVKEKTPPRKRYEYDPHLDPQLVWTGKTERLSFDVDTVSLHIHERLSTQAIVNAVRKNGSKQEEDGRLDLFADPQLPLTEAVEFYQHDVDWANRLILGDSLLVMNSLLERELMAGQVQMVYLDPPYAVSYDSNFQPSTRTRDVRDGRDDSLTREPEQIRAYRDTWTFGVHSYLSYLRDRLLLTRELLSEAGSLFLQIGPDNLNLVALILDEVFGASNRMALINFRKKMMPLGSSGFESVGDYILWYCKNRDSAKTRELFLEQRVEGDVAWSWVELPKGERRRMGRDEIRDHSLLPKASRVFQPISLKPRQYRKNQDFDFEFEGAVYSPPSGSSWSTTLVGMRRLASARRLHPSGQESLRYVLFQDDYPVIRLTSMWTDTAPPQNMRYVVETNATVVARCMIAATDPGDLVFDPTCGSGTAAYVAEQWGRRWITCDTSRVALALARQRILTATYPYYQLAHPDQGVDAGFIYKSVPHVTLGSIANNPRIDEIPDDDPKHREKIEEIVQEYAPQETLYDRPIIETGKVRVSGPFSVESIPVAAIEDPSESPIESWEALDPDAREDDIARAGRGSGRDESTAFVLNLIEALKTSGINTLGGDVLRFSSVNPVRSAGIIQAEGRVEGSSESADGKFYGICFGPRYGPVTLVQVEDAVQEARGRYDGVVFAGFTFDAPAQEFLTRNLPVEVMGALVNPDVLVGDLLKTSKSSQIFTQFGQADVVTKPTLEGLMVEVRGVDVYDPMTGEVHSGGAREIAAWFLDTDYDDRCFNICQAFFPGGGKDPWKKLERALRGTIDKEVFENLRGLESLPFEPGEKVAVKVIDHRGNEMLQVLEPEEESQSRDN